jgi:hypothetical protein
MKTNCDSNHAVNLPQHPSQCHRTLAPSRHADQHDHIDNRRKPHREGPQEQALVWMAEHGREYLRVPSIAWQEITKQTTKSIILRTKKIMEMTRSAIVGEWCSRMETTPVPMVMMNHLAQNGILISSKGSHQLNSVQWKNPADLRWSEVPHYPPKTVLI